MDFGLEGNTAWVMERVGLFGGSFDPIHSGHLILAREARERLGLDRVVLIPAGVSPFKLEAPPAAAGLRLEMVRVAVAEEPGFEVCEAEVWREGATFAIETVRELGALWPGAELFYLIGDDNLADLEKWREIDELRKRVTFVVLTRRDVVVPEGMPAVTRMVDISSTEVRERVAAGLSIRYLVPEGVRTVIEREGLYRGE